MRVCFRGDTVEFKIEFKDNNIPLVPKSAIYPKYRILDVNGVEVQSGTGTLTTPGTYKTSWVIPLDVTLSNEGDTNWYIEWTFIDDNNRSYTLTENFEVKDDILIEEAGREQKFISLAGKPYTAKLQLPLEPYDISLEFVKMPSEELISSASVSLLTHRSSGSLHSYEYTIPALDKDTTYSAVWSITDTAVSNPRYYIQIVNSVSLQLYSLVPSVRMLIDKFQKVAGTVQAYEDSDIIEYLNNGLSWVNATYPATFWCFSANSPIWYMQHFVIIGAAWYGLTAQHILENDLAFNYSGLTTTLDYDRTGGIEAAIGRLREHVKEELPKLKLKAYRLGTGMGHTGVRAFGRRNVFENYSVKLGSTGQGNFVMDYLTRTGIFIP